MKNFPSLNGFNQLCDGRHGTFLINKNDTFVGKSLQTYGEWSEEEVTLFNALCRPGDFVLEAGSNIGSHTIPIAKMIGPNGRLFAFEPQRIVFQTLNANVALNSLTNVHVHHLAIGAEPGKVIIPEINYESSNNFGGIRAHSHDKGETVACVTLDQFMNLPKLRLLKADIEDMEVDLVKGGINLIKKLKPILYIESEPSKDFSQELLSILLPIYPDIYWHVPRMFNPDNFKQEQDNIFSNYASFNILCLPEGCDAKIDIEKFKLKKIITPTDKPF